MSEQCIPLLQSLILRVVWVWFIWFEVYYLLLFLLLYQYLLFLLYQFVLRYCLYLHLRWLLLYLICNLNLNRRRNVFILSSCIFIQSLLSIICRRLLSIQRRLLLPIDRRLLLPIDRRLLLNSSLYRRSLISFLKVF